MAINNLSAFLNPVQVEEQELVISRRFRDENGEPVKWRIRPLTQDENKALIKKATFAKKTAQGVQQELDKQKYAALVIVAATKHPDFSAAELCEAYGTLDPLDVPGKMLLVGEYNRLMEAILDLSGMDAEGNDTDEDTAIKN